MKIVEVLVLVYAGIVIGLACIVAVANFVYAAYVLLT